MPEVTGFGTPILIGRFLNHTRGLGSRRPLLLLSRGPMHCSKPAQASAGNRRPMLRSGLTSSKRAGACGLEVRQSSPCHRSPSFCPTGRAGWRLKPAGWDAFHDDRVGREFKTALSGGRPPPSALSRPNLNLAGTYHCGEIDTTYFLARSLSAWKKWEKHSVTVLEMCGESPGRLTSGK